MSQHIPLPCGQRSRSLKLSLKKLHLAFYSEIATRFMERISADEWQACRSKKLSSRLDHPGRNPYVERLIGTVRRECLDHVIILSEEHLRRILRAYFAYYHEARPHQSLARNSPVEREVELPSAGQVISIRQVGGLHHRYKRAA